MGEIMDPLNVMGTQVDAPTSRKYGGEITKTARAQIALLPELYAAEAEWKPKFNEIGRGELSATRSANTQDVSQLAPRILSILRQYDPQTAALLDKLNQSAQEELKLQGGLDPFMQRSLEQNVRGAQAARGFGWSPGDAAQEAYYLQATREGRRDAGRRFASGVATQTANTYGDPFLRVLGLGSTGPTTGGPTLVNPESSYAQDVYNTNYNAKAAAKIATANNNAAMWSALLGAGGSVAGAAI